MEELLPYFERELVVLRRYAAEFAARFPRIAALLRTTGSDPHAERVLQGVAFIAARIHKRLDDGFPQVTESLLESLYPHYLRPFPSCAIVQFAPAAADSAVRLLPRGTSLTAKQAVKEVHCRFRTAADVTLAPIAIKVAAFDPLIRAPAGTPLANDATAALSISIESHAESPPLSRMPLDRLRIYLDGDPSFCAALRDALFLHVSGAFVEAPDGRWLPLPAVPLAASGFAKEDALIPFGPRSHPAWRVLTEYFCFPDKFRFIDLDLAALRPRLAAGTRGVTLHFALSRTRPDGAASRLLRMLDASHLKLFCTTAVNLFPQAAKPVNITHRAPEYSVVADVAKPAMCELYAIDAVRVLSQKESCDGACDITPLHARGLGGRHWVLRHDEVLARISPGHEKRLTLVDRDMHALEVERSTLAIEATWTHRDLPHQLSFGAPDGDLSLAGATDAMPVRLLTQPGRPQRFATGQALWRLISHLSLNHHALVPEGLPALHELLTLHDLSQSPVTQRLIAGIVGLDHIGKTGWLRHEHGSSQVYGIEVRITIDEEAFTGSGIHLFGQVMDQFLAMYVQVNNFTELALLSARDGKELMRCKRRSGNASPA
ncbi:type VI secretion system protein ImpG [Pseudoduganella lurida]|uniref:Type VI secretion system protein ImpG n=1 Tax=Pseudoduganella lurida TaxID=1036180 RepID=A0A562QVZ5_9BURK|nr:type VI secretion system baseplate subunit TssF [Pseudoduganella lurida]TWI60949.1 type VI secretion system protein ImpG [Pseudoduganella lurida]